MTDHLLRKYAVNIRILLSKVSITPLDYKKKSCKHPRWRVTFHYYQEGKPKRQTYAASSIVFNKQKIQINRLKDHELKVELIELLAESIKHELNTDPRFITSLIYGKDKAKELYPQIFGIVHEETDILTIEKALDEALQEKRTEVSTEFYNGLRTAKDRFLKHIGTDRKSDVSNLSVKMISSFLASKKGSNTTKNNEKARLSTLLRKLVIWEYIPTNYAEIIPKLKSEPKKNKAFSNELRLKIVGELKKTPILYYYYLHIYYGLMRPKTVVRLQVKDVDLSRRMFNTDTKTGNYIKLINDVLMNEMYAGLDLKNANSNHFIFNVLDTVGAWESTEKSKVNFYSKKFKKIKDKFNLDDTYTWYSFRHSAIGNMFEAKAEELKKEGVPNYIEKAIEYVRQFTNHKDNRTTRKYLREISMMLHVDGSRYL